MNTGGVLKKITNGVFIEIAKQFQKEFNKIAEKISQKHIKGFTKTIAEKMHWGLPKIFSKDIPNISQINFRSNIQRNY